MSNKLSKISSLGKKILDAVENQRVTKKYVYEKMDISRGTLDNWINGTTAPSHLELDQLSKILNINLQTGQQLVTQTDNDDVENITFMRDMWHKVKDDSDKKQQEIDRLWRLIDRLDLPGDNIKRIAPQDR